ncbi:hypothetical protein [Mycolicibacterium vaccae]|uniref:Uncharacterized protein n=1 Tax=Mycolicibacterium vaccae ATCC 25954 TaxID=1194972 RepID=K0URH2_MYCVA|nr:hypothetical protein [Mycolicibacterium vaccae]ANI42296.1 hypothetical protein MYVA_5244 [Mycolicibacterium vaccae 95051]EJZ09722.1 hypothetical protein MVAC_11727 [Mycolicibacterium vaccae ATCC 25954]MCV7060732.1 hypothetical protein [Mycolicibacterium vaccae]
MSTALAYLILLSPFALAVVVSWAAHRSGHLRLHRDQFRWAAPMSGRLFDDPDWNRVHHDLDAIRTRFEEHPSWPSSSASGERR